MKDDNFVTGKNVEAVKDFTNKTIKISAGDRGVVENVTVEDFPDFGLSGVKMVHMDFNGHKIKIGELLVGRYVNIV